MLEELVARPADGVVVADAVRAYSAEIRGLAPLRLLGRDQETEDSTHFAIHGPGHWWGWEAPAQAGKTGLMANLALHPPAGVAVVPFFVRRLRVDANNRDAFLGWVLPRLAQLAGRSYVRIPANPAEATTAVNVLLEDAAAACLSAEPPQQILIMIDGLDEDHYYTVAGQREGSIVALLPARLPSNVRVLAGLSWLVGC